MNDPERVVFDCNVFVQGLISKSGPAFACFQSAIRRDISLFASEYVIEEIRDVASREPLASKFRLTEAKVEGFLTLLRTHSTIVESIPHVFSYSRDPDDEHYIDLAAACQAHLIASRDRDLLSLNDPTTEAGRQFKQQFPELQIMTPDELLKKIELR